MFVRVFVNGVFSHVEFTEFDENDIFSMARFERIYRESSPKSDLRFVWSHTQN